MPSVVGNHFYGSVAHEIMHYASVFRLWFTPIVARLAEISHPAATLSWDINGTFLV